MATRTQINLETGESVTVNTCAYVVSGTVVLIDEGQPVPQGAVLASAVPASPAVPQSVTAVQGFTALDRIGKLAALLDYLSAPTTPPLVKAVVMGATEWRRDSLMLMTVAIVLGLSSAQVDDLFVSATNIEV